MCGKKWGLSSRRRWRLACASFSNSRPYAVATDHKACPEQAADASVARCIRQNRAWLTEVRQRGPFHYRWHLNNSPMTAEPYRAKELPLHIRRSCFAPTKTHRNGLMVEAPGTAPGSGLLITQSFIAIVFRANPASLLNIGA